MIYHIIVNRHAIAHDKELRDTSTLPPWRRDVVEKMRVVSKKEESTVAYNLLLRVLRGGFGITEKPDFVIGKHGKPHLLFADDGGDEGCSDRGLHFSISHCSAGVACIVSDEGRVGIDIERLGRYKKTLADYCMSPREVEQIASSASPDDEFTALWTRKEALLKLTGEGITDDMKTVLDSQRMQGVTLTTRICRADGYAYSIALMRK